jgi:hypothetical protein
MKMLQSQKLPWLISILLALANLGLVILLLTGPGRPRPGDPAKRALEAFEEALDLDEAQKTAFSTELQAHFEGMPAKQDAIRDAKGELFSAKGINGSQEESQAMLQNIAQLESDLFRYQLNHFQRLRGLCKDDQKGRFDDLIPKLIQQSPRPGEPPRR